QEQPQQQPNAPSERTAVGKTPTLPEESPLSLRQILGQLNVLREKVIDLITDDKAREGMNEKATSVLNLVARETKSLTDGVKTLMARERTEKAAASSNKVTPAQTARGASEGKMSYAMAARSQKQAQKETQKEARAKSAFIDRQPEQEQPRLWLASIAAKPDPKKIKMVSGLVERRPHQPPPQEEADKRQVCVLQGNRAQLPDNHTQGTQERRHRRSQNGRYSLRRKPHHGDPSLGQEGRGGDRQEDGWTSAQVRPASPVRAGTAWPQQEDRGGEEGPPPKIPQAIGYPSGTSQRLGGRPNGPDEGTEGTPAGVRQARWRSPQGKADLLGTG
ncbi:uncharacterized protein BJ171DRAFT_515240, partial [Polychytrium aggregatum]|uniref:uncharacterized protein n=1 Tax=Polychytrium aggregatum TaxID=110093 RepID=UPI0022FEBC22